MNRKSLIALVLSDIDRADIVDSAPDDISSWLVRAEQRINRELRVRQMKKVATVTTTNALADYPADFVSMTNVALVTSGGMRMGTLDYASDQQIEDLDNSFFTPGTLPLYYTDTGGQIEVFPRNDNYSLKLTYYAKLPALVNDDDTNWLLENRLDLYLSACLIFAYGYTKEDDRAAGAENKVAADIAVLNQADSIDMTGASRLVSRSRNPLGTGAGRRNFRNG